ncbi:hypothetical protein V500_05578 [Pseudogymnoascus sp. VKM F-4518 (FW-2643)]|nr:hypothetical protein V500_05578 [Pseudogymnoascus sp. VKM F-4518 (FW-2643)]
MVSAADISGSSRNLKLVGLTYLRGLAGAPIGAPPSDMASCVTGYTGPNSLHQRRGRLRGSAPPELPRPTNIVAESKLGS